MKRRKLAEKALIYALVMPEEEIATSICAPPLVVFGFDRHAPDKTGGQVRERTRFRDAMPHTTYIVRVAFFL